MPKKKRNQRVREEAYTGRTSRRSPYSSIAASPATDLPDNVIRNNFAIGEDVDPANCLKYLQEMFHGKLDPDVIHMVLTECEFSVDVALEGLLTLLNETPESGPGLLLSMPKGPKRSNLSSSSSSESVATENIVTSEAEVHKSSEESERESLRGMDKERTSSAFGQSSDSHTHTSKFSSPSLADLVDAPPFVPSTNYAAPPLYSEVSKLLGSVSDITQETMAHREFCTHPTASEILSAKIQSVSQQEQEKIQTLVGNGEKVLILMRGLPGSGKTTLAEKIRGGGLVLSADHFFYKRDVYKFDKARLPEAHEWNKGRVKRAVEEGRTPVIIDNTNIEAWEMMPYVAIALRSRYHVVVLEPDTPWKFNVRQLARRNIHGVVSRSLEFMLERYDRDITAESLCKSLGLSPQESPESTERRDVSASTCAEADPLKDLSWRKAMESAGDEKIKNCEHEATPVSEETISLQDLMVLVQNDSEESSNRSRQSSGSWSSDQECNDWEEVTDDDFLWKATAKNAIMKKHSVQSAIETVSEEPELCGTQGESDVEEEKELRTDLKKELKDAVVEPGCEVHDGEAMGDAPKPQRPLESFRAIAKSVHPLEKDEEISFSESWDTQGNKEVEVLDEGSKPQRQRDSLKKQSSEVFVTKSLENLTLASANSPEKAKGTKSLESISKVSSKISLLTGHHDTQHRLKENRVFGLQRAVKDVSWSIPEFTSCELLQSDEKKDTTALAIADDRSPAYSAGATTSDEFISCESLQAQQKKDTITQTAADDWSLVHRVLMGKSDELPFIIPRDNNKTANIDTHHPMLKRPCNMRDQSTTTTDLPTPDLDPLDRLELLQQCIPEASKPDLEDIFHQCHGDHIWAADLLLESGTVGDLKHLVIREDAEERAESIISSEPEDKKDVQFQQQMARDQSNNMHVFSQPSASGQPILYGDYGAYEEYSGGETYYRCEAANYYTVDGAYEMANGHGMEGTEQDGDPPFLLTLTPAFASQLVETFGSDGLHVSTDAFNSEDLSVTISHSLAREVHRLWMETLRHTLNREDQEMIEMAQETRRQQNQEDPCGTSSNESVRLTQDSDFPIPPTPQWTKPPHEMSFKEIMEMEAELEKRRKERIKKSDTDMATKLKNQKLYDKFPGIDRQALDEIFAANNYSLLQSVSTINETLGIDPSVSDAAEHQEAIAELVMTESRLQHEDEDMAWCPTVEGHEKMYERLQVFGDYDALRREATVHYHLRQDSFQKAKSAYHRGMKTVAAFYSQQGRLHAEKMRAANERASGILFDLRNASCDDNTLDLHGLHVQEAIQVLKNFVKLKKREAWCLQKRMVLRVITGRGAHSSHNIPKVKFAVEGYLRSSQLNYNEVQAGMFHIKL